MSDLQEHHFWLNAKKILRARLSITEDKAEDSVIDDRIRGNINMHGSNLWILMFAIFVASIGLNVNSTAVIIGAMLISPLMGPIMGLGYGAGINDFVLIRASFKNLIIATLIGLLTSTLYFLISPLDTAQSELLARTTPTAWDVLIGFFGGFAGIVGVTRKEISNVIPGVAIATALMPPLCTAGFGVATGHWSYFFGAFYLYTINFVFIALSTFIVVRAFNVTEKKYVDPNVAKRTQHYIMVVVIATILPSSYLAYKLVGEEVFKAQANSFINEQMNFKNTNVAQVKIDTKTHEIKVFLIGEHVTQKELNNISARLSGAGLKNAILKIYQNGEQKILNFSTLKADIVTDLYKNSQIALEDKDKQIANLKAQVQQFSTNRESFKEISKELETLFPNLNNVFLSQGYEQVVKDDNKSETRVILNGETHKRLNKKEQKQIEEWLKLRMHTTNISVYIH